MYTKSTQEMRDWLRYNMKINCDDFAEGHILAMYTAQMIIRDNNESDEMRNYALFNYRSVLHGSVDEQETKRLLTKQEQYRQEMEYGAFNEIDWDSVIEQYEDKN